jgi:hypothetical protein
MNVGNFALRHTALPLPAIPLAFLMTEKIYIQLNEIKP